MLSDQRKHVAAHIIMASDDGYKEGRFIFKEIHKYLLQGVYPSSFSKSDKQALLRLCIIIHAFFTMHAGELM